MKHDHIRGVGASAKHQPVWLLTSISILVRRKQSSAWRGLARYRVVFVEDFSSISSPDKARNLSSGRNDRAA
jgi:hypothetical protein